MQSFLDQFRMLRREGRQAALATVVGIEEGSGKRVASRMWVDADGRTYGSLTVGGCVDGRTREEALRTLADRQPRRFEVELGEDGLDFGMSCAGSVDVHVALVDLSDEDDPVVMALETVQKEVAEGRRAVFAMPLHSGASAYAATDDPLPVESGWHLEDGVFFQSFVPPPRLIVVGAAPTAEPLVKLGKMLGFRVAIVDGKEEHLAEKYPEADETHFGIPSETVRALRPDDRTAVVLTAHDYRYEVPVLKEILEREVAYVGMVASRRRGGAVLDFIEQSGTPNTERVRTPVGLDIGASTPAEIAVSILAEIVAEREQATGLSLSVFRTMRSGPLIAAHTEKP